MAKEPLLRPEEVASVLEGDGPAAAQDRRTPLEESTGSSSYSLRKPVAIPPSGEEVARQRLETLRAGLQHALQQELEAPIELGLQGFQQEQVSSSLASLPQPFWGLCLLHADRGGLVLALDPTCALGVVELALGGAGKTAASGRAPTPLESRVLNKLCGDLALRLGKSTDMPFAGGAFGCGEVPRKVASPGQTVGVGMLKVQLADVQRNGLLLATADLLREPGDSVEPGEDGPLAPLLERVPVAVRPVLGAGLVTLANLTALEPETVLRLEAPESRLLELRVNNETLFKGRLRREEGAAPFHVVWRHGRHSGVGGAEQEES